MVTRHAIMALVNRHVGRVLDVAEASLPADNFPAFRKITMREFGEDELAAELDRLLRQDAAGTERNGAGRHSSGTKGGAP